jgi:hypothetical protein
MEETFSHGPVFESLQLEDSRRCKPSCERMFHPNPPRKQGMTATLNGQLRRGDAKTRRKEDLFRALLSSELFSSGLFAPAALRETAPFPRNLHRTLQILYNARHGCRANMHLAAMSKMKSRIENPYEPSGTSYSLLPSQKSVLLAFLAGAGAGVFPVFFVFPSWSRWDLPLFREYGVLLFVAYFPLFGLVSSRLRLSLLYCYLGLVLVCVGGTDPWLPVNVITAVGYTSTWWLGVFLNLILTGLWRSKPS